MAFEELQHMVALREAMDARQAEVMRLVMLFTAESLATGEIAAGDPEFTALPARAQAQALVVAREAAGSGEKFARMVAKYAAAPGGEEAVAEAMRRQAAAALAALAEEYAAFMRCVGALSAADLASDSDSYSDSSEAGTEAAAAA